MPWCYIRKNRRLEWDYCNVRKCTEGETHAHTPKHLSTSSNSLLLLVLPLSSAVHRSSAGGPSGGPGSRPVLAVRQAAALSNQQDFWGWKGLPRRPPLAGFPPGQTQELWLRLWSHVWRDPAVVLLGSDCGPLHVGVTVCSHSHLLLQLLRLQSQEPVDQFLSPPELSAKATMITKWCWVE